MLVLLLAAVEGLAVVVVGAHSVVDSSVVVGVVGGAVEDGDSDVGTGDATVDSPGVVPAVEGVGVMRVGRILMPLRRRAADADGPALMGLAKTGPYSRGKGREGLEMGGRGT